MTRPANPFAATGAGAQYVRGRPYHHPAALARAVSLGGVGRFGRALDVACGTGMSTRALGEVADAVVGVDRSPVMLAHAPALANARYVLAGAEHLPFAPGSFDAVTVASGVHWFDQPAFFAECRRVLRPPALVILYDHYFLGEMPGEPRFAAWTAELFARHPLPPRSPQVGDPRGAVPDGFERLGEDVWADDVAMTGPQLVEYVMSLSNVVDAVERGAPAAEVRRWLTASTAGFFAGSGARAVRFLATVAVLRVAGAGVARARTRRGV